ncbi:MAG TPA: hypothetical protein VHS80_06365 [Chthoniobacterales bacterium]|nr:hypothetical protein [Chthoniobacterales bacterium]
MHIDLDYAKLDVTIISEDEAAAVDGQKLIPRGTFAGTIYQPGLVRNGQSVACDTAEQGGGQN